MIIKTTLLSLSIILALKGNINSNKLNLPVQNGFVSSDYGMRVHPLTKDYRLHTGIDIVPDKNKDAHSVGAGIVIYSGSYGGYGNLVVIKHVGDITTHYAHLESVNYRVGDLVSRGAVIGQIGSSGRTSGIHLHFEIRKSGKSLNPSKVFSAFSKLSKR